MQVEHEVEDVARRRRDGRGRFANDHGDERKPRNRRLVLPAPAYLAARSGALFCAHSPNTDRLPAAATLRDAGVAKVGGGWRHD
jgi:hypothetical protein